MVIIFFRTFNFRNKGEAALVISSSVVVVVVTSLAGPEGGRELGRAGGKKGRGGRQRRLGKLKSNEQENIQSLQKPEIFTAHAFTSRLCVPSFVL